MVRYSNTHFSIEKTGKKKISKDTDLNNTINQIELIDIYRTPNPPQTAKYILHSIILMTFTKKDHMWGHEISLNKFKMIQVIQNSVL